MVEAVAADGYRETYPLSALAGQDVLVAFGMNGAELPSGTGTLRGCSSLAATA